MYARLKPVALGVALGLVWGLSIFLLTFFIMQFGVTGELTAKLGRVYRGYTVTAPGAFIGLAYGFVHAFVVGWFIAFVYNKLVSRD